MSRFLEIKDLSYVLLMREVVVQLNQSQLMSDKPKGTFGNIDSKKCCEPLQEVDFLSRWNGAKININYITKKVDSKTQEIHPLFFNILKDTIIIEENGSYFIEFKDYNDLLHFELFKSFKGVNSSIYDVESKNIKLALKTYQESSTFKKVSFDSSIHFDLGLNLNSLILEDNNGEQIYSNRLIFEIQDFFNYYGGDKLELKSYEKVSDCILTKLEQNKVYVYSKAKNNKVFDILAKDIEDTITKLYEKFVDIDCSIGKALNMSFEELENLNDELKEALLKRISSRKKSNKTKKEEREKELKELQIQQNIKTQNLNNAIQLGNKLKVKIINIAVEKGFEKTEVQEEFSDIVQDVAFRRPEACNDENAFIEAFLNEA